MAGAVVVEPSAPEGQRYPKNLFTAANAAVMLWLVGASAVAWATLASSGEMGTMFGRFGNEAMHMHATGIAAFMTMWITMIVAMMFPVVAPMVAAHRMMVRSRGVGRSSTVAFVAGYIVVWGTIGLLPAFFFRSMPGVHDALGREAMAIAGGVLISFAGLYQLTPWKQTCLRSCRHPLAFLMTHDFSSGALGAFRAGSAHGAYCLGCCWGLMVVLAVVGIANLLWMACLTAIFLIERYWRKGDVFARVLGPTLAVGGVLFAVLA